MNLPQPYIFKLDTPLIYFGGSLYQANNKTEQTQNFISINDQKYSIEKISSPSELEELYYAHNLDSIDQFKEQFIQETLNREYVSRDEVSRRFSQNNVLSVIINEILPVITAIRFESQIDAAIEDDDVVPASVADESNSRGSRRRSRPRSRNSLSANRSQSDSNLREILDDLDSAATRNGSNRTNNNRDEQTLREAQNISRDLINRIEQEYSQYSRARRNSRSTVVDSQIDSLLGLRDAPVDRSILKTHLMPGINFLKLDNGLYELLNYGEYLEIFKEKMDPIFYRDARRISSKELPETVNEFIGKNINHIQHKIRSRIKNKLRGMILNMDGNYQIPIYVEEQDQLQSKYNKLTERKVKIEAVQDSEFQTRQLAEIAEERNKLERLAQLSSYEKNGAGFKSESNGYWAYITTPPYVLKSPHTGDYFKFGSAKVGVFISDNGYGDGQVSVGNPHILNKYAHPFLSGNTTNQTLCMGNYNKDDARRLNPGQCALTLLTKAKETLMMGYRTGSNPYKRLNATSFPRKVISEAKMRQEGLVCLNVF
ncbi:hypothetical protein HOK51_04315 [Candidatus Woesearchaeota archaeon]|jgi:hypothetical protein|nr:hypothetical protein [Candidatus Woesearchaeota archaeon]MBT6519047.1 hypothetical protein [Candidatus Woesearchaeota archaeon]MBT7367483.1 hypothetical protein [Candidatus Woesearchaeota archaeon]